jgi:hypothetical protein
VYVALFLEVGLLLLVLPWSTFWDRNYFAHTWPFLQHFIANDYLRGAVSGLGLLNLLAGFAELAPVFAPRERQDASVAASSGSYSNARDTQVGP